MRTFFLLLSLSGLSVACGGSLEAAPVAAFHSDPAQVQLLTPDDQIVWWHQVTELGSAIAWIGPPMVDSQQRQRRQWVMTCTLIGSAQPAMWFQSTVDLDGSEPLGMDGGDYSVLLRPEAGYTWKDVRVPSDLAVEAFGL